MPKLTLEEAHKQVRCCERCGVTLDYVWAPFGVVGVYAIDHLRPEGWLADEDVCSRCEEDVMLACEHYEDTGEIL